MIGGDGHREKQEMDERNVGWVWVCVCEKRVVVCDFFELGLAWKFSSFPPLFSLCLFLVRGKGGIINQ